MLPSLVEFLLGLVTELGRKRYFSKIQETSGDFCILQTFLDVLLCGLAKSGRSTMGMRITNGG